jgi:hypothetical protein
MATYPIYILAIGAYPEWDANILPGLRKYLNRRSGIGWKIKSCVIRRDRIIETILANLDRLNGGSPVEYIVSSYALFKLNIEFIGEVDYRIFPCLEDEIKWYIANNEDTYCAGYFFCPISLKGEPSLRIFAGCHASHPKKDEIGCDDDFTYIQRLAGFIYRYLYYHDADKEYPHIVATLLLQFGGDPPPDKITT